MSEGSTFRPVPVTPLKQRTVVRVRAVPSGDAPEWVRRAWVDVRIPVPGANIVATDNVGFGAISSAVRARRSYAVPLYCAAEALRLSGRQDAARWWLSQAFATDALQGELLFDEDCVVIER